MNWFKGRKSSPYITTEVDPDGHFIYKVYDLRGNWYPFVEATKAREFLDYIKESEAFNPLSAGFKSPMDMCLKKWKESEVVVFAPITECVMVSYKSGEGGEIHLEQARRSRSWQEDEDYPRDFQI